MRPAMNQRLRTNEEKKYHGRVLRSNSAPEQCPGQVPAYFRMCVWALLAPPSRRRARISPPSNSQAMRLPGNKPAAWRIAIGMLVVPLLVKIVSFVFTVRIISLGFLPVHLRTGSRDVRRTPNASHGSPSTKTLAACEQLRLLQRRQEAKTQGVWRCGERELRGDYSAGRQSRIFNCTVRRPL